MPRRSLTIQQQRFAEAIANPGSPTYSNGTASARAVAPRISNNDSAAQYASKLMRHPKVRSEIDAILAKHDLGIDRRARTLSSILSADSVVVEQRDADGVMVSSTKSPNYSNQLKAIDMLSRMDGTYAKAGEVARAQARVLEPVLEAYSRQLRDSLLPPKKGAATGTRGEATERADSVQGEDMGESVPDSVAGHGEGMGGQEEAGADGGEGGRPPGDA